MAVTENDITQNAAAIAALINTGAANVNITDLDAVTTLSASDLFHVSVSGVDKKITKDNALTDPIKYIDFPAGSFDYPVSDPAPLDTDSGTNGTIKRHLFDDSTVESVIAQIQLPDNIDTSGTVTFTIYGYASTWVTGKNVAFRISTVAKNDDEDWDTAFTNTNSGDMALNTSGQDYLDELTFTETISNLGWADGDFVRLELMRRDAASDDLSGDYGLVHFRIAIPRT